jgi:hypothetical protein
VSEKKHCIHGARWALINSSGQRPLVPRLVGMQSVSFPQQLPNPDDLYSVPGCDIWAGCQLPEGLVIRTFPDLFPEEFGGPFHPVNGVHLLMPDMLRLQLLFAARQVLTYLCMEMGLRSVAEAPPFELHGIPGLYQELGLFIAMLSNVMLHALIFFPEQSTTQRIWTRFKEECMPAYAPWCRFQHASEWKAEAVRLQGVLEDLSSLHTDFCQAQARFELFADTNKAILGHSSA